MPATARPFNPCQEETDERMAQDRMYSVCPELWPGDPCRRRPDDQGQTGQGQPPQQRLCLPQGHEDPELPVSERSPDHSPQTGGGEVRAHPLGPGHGGDRRQDAESGRYPRFTMSGLHGRQLPGRPFRSRLRPDPAPLAGLAIPLLLRRPGVQRRLVGLRADAGQAVQSRHSR